MTDNDLEDAFARATMLRNAGQYSTACILLRQALPADADADACYRVALFCKQSRREGLALELCESALARGLASPRLRALAGVLAQMLGRFEQARRHLLDAWAAGIDPEEWQVLPALAHTLRYSDAHHADRVRLEQALARPQLRSSTRSALHFALGKFFDDVGDHAAAVQHWREAHRLGLEAQCWDEASWHRRVAIARHRLDLPPVAGPAPVDPAPVLVVGMPRSGTTLLAEQLAQLPGTVNRGELPFLLYVHEQIAAARTFSPGLATDARALWQAHLRQDDGAPVRLYLDKNPMNLLAVDSALLLCPQTRVIWCTRAAADNALSLWTQSFGHADYAFSHRFEDIATVQRDVEELRRHALARWPDRIAVVDYGELVTAPAKVSARLCTFLGIKRAEPSSAAAPASAAIGSASLWQARQPIHVRSLGRAARYLHWLPELAGFAGLQADR
jgi:tetratricopeptide (TPR) repeat protein